MSNIVKYTEFRKVAENLWNIVKTNFITRWIDLEHVKEIYTFVNLFNHKDTKKFPNTGPFQTSGNIVGNGNTWKRILIPVVGGKTYYIMSKLTETNTSTSSILGSSDFIFFSNYDNTADTGTRVGNIRVTSTTSISGKNVLQIQAHNDANYLGFNISNTIQNAEEELMVWDSTQTFPQQYIQGSIVDKIVIDGEKVDTTFTSTSGLASGTVREALDEININMVKADADNNFTGKNTFDDVRINGGSVYKNNELGTGVSAYTSSNTTGSRTLSCALFPDNYVESLRVYATSTSANTVSGVSVWEVRKSPQGRAYDTVNAVIVDNQSYQIIGDKANGGYIEIPIRKTYPSYHVYYIVRIEGGSPMQRVTGIPSGANQDNNVNSLGTPTVGQNLPNPSSLNMDWTFNMSITGRRSMKQAIVDISIANNVITITKMDGTVETKAVTFIQP